MKVYCNECKHFQKSKNRCLSGTDANANNKNFFNNCKYYKPMIEVRKLMGDKEKADKILNTKPHGKNWLRNDIVLALTLAREEGRQKERRRCIKVAKQFTKTWIMEEDSFGVDSIKVMQIREVHRKQIANAIKESGEI